MPTLTVSAIVRLYHVLFFSKTFLSRDVLFQIEGQDPLHSSEIVDQGQQFLLVVSRFKQPQRVIVFNQTQIQLVNVLDMLVSPVLGLVHLTNGILFAS